MTTDQSNMVQEVIDPRAPETSKPEGTTTKETAKNPVTNIMDGDIQAAYAQLKKVIVYLESLSSPNEDMIRMAKSIRDQYIKSKIISKEQYQWIQEVVLPVTESVPTMKLNESPESVYDPEDAIRLAELNEKRKADQLERDKEAPRPSLSVPNIPPNEKIIVTPKPDPEIVEQVMSETTNEEVTEENITEESSPEEPLIE